MLEYTFRRAEKLSLTHKQLLDTMDAEELLQWLAFDMLQDEEYRKQINLKIAHELSDEEKDNNLRALLSSFGKH